MRVNVDDRLRRELLNFSVNGKPNSKAFTVYVYLLMTAQYKENVVNGISLQCGQAITSVRRLSADTGLTEREVRTTIKDLVENGYIEQHSTNHYTIFTLCHYSNDTPKATDTKQDKATENTQMDKQEQENYRNELIQKAISGNITAEEKEILNNL